jgi:hypothetical protein
VIAVLGVSFAALCIGFFLLGVAAVKEAFWPVATHVHRVECGATAVETRDRG